MNMCCQGNSRNSIISYGEDRKIKQDVEEGIRLAVEAVLEDYTRPPELQWLSNYLERSGRYQEMIKIYEKLAASDPNYYVPLSGSYIRNGQRGKAVEIADRALVSIEKLSKRNAELLANIYKQFGDNKKRTEVILKSEAFGPARIEK